MTATTFGALDLWARFWWRGTWWRKTDWSRARNDNRAENVTEGVTVYI